MIQIYDNFLTNSVYLNFLKIFEESFVPTYEPIGNTYINRFEAYPCHEKIIEDQNLIKDFVEQYQFKTNIPIEKCKILARKTYIDEINQSPFKNKTQGFIHKDSDSADFAGVLYLENSKSGTSFHDTENHLNPNIFVQAKENRLVTYLANVAHAANIDLQKKVRMNIAFFIQVKK